MDNKIHLSKCTLKQIIALLLVLTQDKPLSLVVDLLDFLNVIRTRRKVRSRSGFNQILLRSDDRWLISYEMKNGTF